MAPSTERVSAPGFVDQLLPLTAIHESKSNPRRRFDEEALEELASSVRTHGILEPLLVRPNAKGYELVAGARRLRAAKIAGLEQVPCRVREFTDREALEVQIIENLQRKDIHPLEETDAYLALQKADKAYTAEAIAARVGRSVAYVKGRLKLQALGPDARKAFDEEKITAAHAAILAKVPLAQQKDAIESCFYRLFQDEDGENGLALQPVRELESWYRENVVLDVAAPETRELFPDLAKTHDEVTAAGAALVPITHDWFISPAERKKFATPPLTSEEWKKVQGKKATCDHTQTGVVIIGRGRAEVHEICANKKCAKHWPELQPKPKAAPGKPEPKRPLSKWELDQQRERQLAAKLAKVKVPACQALLTKLEGKPLTAEAVRWLVDQVRPVAIIGQLESVLGPESTWTPARATQLLLFCFTLKGSYNLGQLAKALKKAGVDAVKLAADAKKAKAAPAAKKTAKAAARGKGKKR